MWTALPLLRKLADAPGFGLTIVYADYNYREGWTATATLTRPAGQETISATATCPRRREAREEAARLCLERAASPQMEIPEWPHSMSDYEEILLVAVLELLPYVKQVSATLHRVRRPPLIIKILSKLAQSRPPPYCKNLHVVVRRSIVDVPLGFHADFVRKSLMHGGLYWLERLDPTGLISTRAHNIWIKEGRPEGRADEHWRLAKEELSMTTTIID